jgi:transcriptional regulator with XRE-family HTH domain
MLNATAPYVIVPFTAIIAWVFERVNHYCEISIHGGGIMSITALWERSLDYFKENTKLSWSQVAELEHLSNRIVGTPGINVDDAQAVEQAIRQLRTVVMVLEKMADDGQLPTDSLMSIYKTIQNAKTVANRLLFGSKLRRHRNAKGYNVTQLASKIGVDRSYISKLENAAAGPPDMEVIRKLTEVLGIPLSELIVDAIGRISPEIGEDDDIADQRTMIIADIAKECRALPEEYLDLLLAQVQAIAQTYRQRKFKSAGK